jgi:pimeloyl-ACP methyl ester carboxylesterase
LFFYGMLPRKRTNKGEGSASVAESVRPAPRDADSGETTEEYPRFQPSIYRRPRRIDGVKWFPVVKRLFYVSLLILVPMILNYAALNHEMRVLPPKGAVVYDIGWGQKLLLHCTGSGLPTVVLEAPIGQASYVWSRVQPILAKQTRVCSYDRAGLGFSDRAYQNTSRYTEDYGNATRDRDKTLPSTIERMVEDIHKLLTVASNQPRPFIMVSSDFTTMISRFYAQLYEYELAGLLLIDPAPETIFDPDTPSSPSEPAKPSPPGTDDEYLATEARDNSPWTTHWYRKTVPHLQSLHMSGSLGFNRLGLMAGLMTPVEVPELSGVLTDDIIAIKVSSYRNSIINLYHNIACWCFCSVEAPSMSAEAPIISI